MPTFTTKLGLGKPVPQADYDYGNIENPNLDILDDALLSGNINALGTISFTDHGDGTVTFSGSGSSESFVTASGHLQAQITANAQNVNASTGAFSTSLTVSGQPVALGAGVSDPLSIGTINVATSLTVSGVPVDIAGGGGGGSDIEDINGISSGSVTIAGAGGISVSTLGQTITVDGTAVPTSSVTASGSLRRAVAALLSNQSIAHSTVTHVAWDTEVLDIGGWYTTSSGNVMTVPPGVSLVRIQAQVRWAALVQPARMQFILQKNGQNVTGALPTAQTSIEFQSGDTGNNALPIQLVSTYPIPCTSGDQFNFTVVQTNGTSSTRDISGAASNWFAIEEVIGGFDNITVVTGTVTGKLVVARGPTAAGTEFMEVYVDDRRGIFHVVQDEAGGAAGGFQFDLGGNVDNIDSFIVSQNSDLQPNPSNVLFIVRPDGTVGIGDPDPTSALEVTVTGTNVEALGLTLKEGQTGSEWRVIDINANANTANQNTISWQFDSIAPSAGPAIGATRPDAASTDLVFSATNSDSRVELLRLDGSANAVDLAEDLLVQGTRVNVVNLPTASGGLASGDLWRDGSGFVRITP